MAANSIAWWKRLLIRIRGGYHDKCRGCGEKRAIVKFDPPVKCSVCGKYGSYMAWTLEANRAPNTGRHVGCMSCFNCYPVLGRPFEK